MKKWHQDDTIPFTAIIRLYFVDIQFPSYHHVLKKGAFSWYIALSQLIMSGITRETVRHGDARDWPQCAVVAISPDFAKNSTPMGFLVLCKGTDNLTSVGGSAKICNASTSSINLSPSRWLQSPSLCDKSVFSTHSSHTLLFFVVPYNDCAIHHLQ